MKKIIEVLALISIFGFGAGTGYAVHKDKINDENRVNELYIQVIEKTNDSLKIENKQLKSKIELPITIFTITRNNMQVVSSLGSEQDTFTKYHHYELKDGINSDYVVLQEGQSFEWIVTNY